jgi:phage terminase large subunit-like protein
MFDQAKAARAIRFIENLKHTKSPFHGQLFTLFDWQRPIISDVYGTVNSRGLRQYRYVYLEVPKKNGKSEIVAALGLFHVFADHEINGQVYGCAGDKEQATLVFDVAVEMIDQIPALKKRAKLNLSTKMITDRVSGTFYKAVSAEAYTKHGLNLSACIFDELHVQPNRDLFDVMTKGAGDARLQPIWWLITTAGDDPDRVSIGWEVHEKAENILRARKAKDKEKDITTWYPVIYSYQGEDIYNEKNWKIANPSLGKTFDTEKIREAAMEAKLSPADERLFRWLRLNQWVTTKLTGWLPVDLFDATTAKDWTRADLLGKDCYLGLDLSSTTDLSALCSVFPPQKSQRDWRVIWDCWVPEDNMKERIRHDKVPYDAWAAEGWIYPTPGNVIDYDLIEKRILECKELYKILEVDADKTFAGMLLQRLQQQGVECVDIPQTYAQLTDPMNYIEILLRSKQTIKVNGQPVEIPMLTHEPNPVARWCFGNTSIHKNGNAQIKFVKESKGRGVVRTKRIDLTAAWVFATSRAKFYATRPDLSKILDDNWGM